MIPEIGQFALILALCIAIVQSIFPLAGAALGVQRWVALARPAAMGQFLFVAIAYACLTWAFIDHDFSVLYVAKNSNTQLPKAMPRVKNNQATLVQGRDQRAQAESTVPDSSAAIENAKATENPT